MRIGELVSPQPWVIEKHPDTKVISIIASSGYTFHFLNEEELLSALQNIIVGVNITTMYSDRLGIVMDNIVVIDIDPWLNPGHKFGDSIAQTYDLSETILAYIKRQWLKSL